MAKRIVLAALQRVFADYIVELNEENLRLGVWNGRLELENLQINNEAINALGLPVRVISGEVIKFSVYIPWLSLDRTPVRVEIDGVYLLMGAVRREEWSSADVRKRKLGIKQSMVNAAMKKNIAMRESNNEKTTALNSKQPRDNEGFISRLAQRVIDNIEIRVQNVHIRYEDSNLGAPEGTITSVGITLGEFLLTTTDENFEVAFVDRLVQRKTANGDDSAGGSASFHQPLIQKLATLKKFGLYWRHSDTIKISEMNSVEDMREALNSGVTHHNINSPNTAGHGGGFLLRPPYDILLKVVHDEDAGRIDRAYYFANLDNAILDLDLSTEQLEQALALKDGITALSNWSVFSSHRPTRKPQDDPRAWWRYAYICITGRGSDYNKMFKILTFRKLYIRAYKLKVRYESNPSAFDSGDEEVYDESTKLLLDDLEYELPVQTIVLFRHLADLEMRAEDNARKRLKQQKGSSGGDNQKPEWMRWLFGDNARKDLDEDVDDELDIEAVAKNIDTEYSIAEEIAGRKMEITNLEEDTAAAKPLFHIQLSSSGTLGLQGRGKNRLVEVHLSGSLKVEMKRRNDVRSMFKVENFKVVDLYTQSPFFPRIVEPLAVAVKESSVDKNALVTLRKLVPDSTESTCTPLLSCQCHISPQGTDVSISASPLRFVYNCRLFTVLSSAFQLGGRRELESIQTSIFMGLEEAKGKAEAYFVQTQHLRVRMDIQAPLIVIPSNTTVSPTQSRTPSCVSSSRGATAILPTVVPNTILYVDCGKIMLNGGAEARANHRGDEKEQKWKAALTEVQVLIVRSCSAIRRLMIEPFRIEVNASFPPRLSSSLSGRPSADMSISLLPKLRGVACPADVRAFREILDQVSMNDDEEDLALRLQTLVPHVRYGVTDMVEKGEALRQVVPKGQEREDTGLVVTSDGEPTSSSPSHTNLALSLSLRGVELVLLKPRASGNDDCDSYIEEDDVDKELFYLHLGELHTDIKICPRDTDIQMGFCGLVLKEARGEGGGVSHLSPGQQYTMRDMVCSTNGELDEDLISVHVVVLRDKSHSPPAVGTAGVVDQPLSSDPHQYGIYANLKFRTLILSLSSSSLDSFSPFFTAFIGRDNNMGQGGGQFKVIESVDHFEDIEFDEGSSPELVRGPEEEQKYKQRKPYHPQQSFTGNSLAKGGYRIVPSVIWQTALLAQKEMENKSLLVECHLERVSLEMLHNSTLSFGSSSPWGGAGDPVIRLTVSQLESEARFSGSNTDISFSLYEVRIVDARPVAASNALTIIFAPITETESEVRTNVEDRQPCYSSDMQQQPCCEPLVEVSYTSSLAENRQDQNMKIQLRRFHCNLMTGPIRQGLRLAQETQEALWRMMGFESRNDYTRKQETVMGGYGSARLSTAASNLPSLPGRKATTRNAAVCEEQMLNVSFKLCEAKFQLIENPSSLRTRRLVLRLSAEGVLKRRCDVGTTGSSFCDDDFKASVFDLESFVVYGTPNRGDVESTKQISEPISANIGVGVMRNMGSLVSADLSLNLTELHTEVSYMDILLVTSAVKNVLEAEERKISRVDNVARTNSGVIHTPMLQTRQQQFTMEELMVAGEIVELGEDDLVEEEKRSNTTLVSEYEKVGEESNGCMSKCVPIIRIGLKWNFASVIITNDYEGLGVPVLSFCVSDVVFEGDGPATELLLAGRMIVEAQFFNAKVAQWEPLLEPWYPKFHLVVDRDWRINVQITDVHDGDEKKLQLGLEEEQSYCPLLINVSEEMLESLSSTYWMLFLDSSSAAFGPGGSSGGLGGTVERGGESSVVTNCMNFQSSKSSLSLRNEGGSSSSSIVRGGRSSMYTLSSANFTFWNHTGLEIVVSTVCPEVPFKDGDSISGIALESSFSCNLSVNQCSVESSRGNRGGGLSLRWKGHLAEQREPLQKLPINKCGKFLYSLVPFDPPPAGHVYAFPVVEETWEYSQFHYFSHKWVPPDPSERPRWATRDYCTRGAGKGGAKVKERRMEDIKLPSSQWEWLDDWHPDKSSIEVGEIDEEGWEYAVGFNAFNVATKSRTKQDFDQARRRRWIRTRAPCPLPLEDPHRPLDLVLDIQATLQGRLEVKASSTIRIINETMWPLEVSCLCSAWQDNSAHLGTISAHHMHYVPLLLAYASHYQLRPATLSNDMPDFSWCSPFAVYANGLNESLVVWATCARRNDDSQTNSTTETLDFPRPVHLVVFIEREGDKLACLRVVPPLIVVNALPCGLRFRAHQRKYDIQAELQSNEKVQQLKELQQQVPSSYKGRKQSICEIECGQISPADSLGLYCVYLYAQAEIEFRVPHFEWSIGRIPCLPFSLKDIRSKFHDMQVEFRLHDGAGGYLHVVGQFERQFPKSLTCPAVKLTVYAELWFVDRTGLSIDFEIDGMKVAKPMTVEGDGESKTKDPDTSYLPQMPSVENLWTESETRYSIGTVTSGTRIYVDRAYSFVSSTIPPNLRNCILIQTAHGDKNEVSSCPSMGWLQFRITCPATVYLLFDSRAISVPQWISDAEFQRTRQDVVIKHSGRVRSVECCFSVYATTIKEMEGKVIRLGGNKAPGASTMYIVILGPFQKHYVCADEPEATSTTSDHCSQPSQSPPLIAKDAKNSWTSGTHGMFLSKRGKGLLKIGVSERRFVGDKGNSSSDVVGGCYRGQTTGVGDKTYWCEILHLLGAEGAGGIVTVTDGTRNLELTFRIERCHAIFMRSMKVTVLQRFAVVNLLPVPLQLRQVREGCMTFEPDSAPPDVEIPVGSWSAWRWKSVNGPRLVRLRVPNSNWSLGGVAVDIVGLTALHLPSRAMEEGGGRIFKHRHVISVDVKLGSITDDFSLQIVVWGTSRSFIPHQPICRLLMIHKQCIPMYRLVNMSDVCVIFWQIANDIEKEPIVLGKGRWVLKPGTATSFGWSYLDSPKQLNIMVNGESNSAQLNTEGIGNVVWCPGEAKAFAQVLVQGGTKTILVTRVPPEKLCWKDGRTTVNTALGGSYSTTAGSHKTGMVDAAPSPICVSCTLRGISFSLIGSKFADATEPQKGTMRHELVYAQVSDIKAKVIWGLTGSVEVEAAGIQIDNHVDGRVYPVMLGKHPDMNEYSKSGALSEPLVHFSLVTQLDERSGTRHYEYVALRVLDLLAQADSASCVALLALVAPIISYLDMAGRAFEKRQSSKIWLSSFTSEVLHRIEDERIMNTSFRGGWLDFNRLLNESESQTRVFFREIVLHPIILILNWAATPVPMCLMERAGGFATSLSAIPTLSHSRLSLSSYIAEDVFGFQEELGRNLLAFYTCQFTRQVMKLIGSLRALGSPADLVSGVGNGAKAFLYAPIQGNILKPTEYVAGISSGAELFARETVKGVFNAMAGLGGGASNLAAKLAFDNTYERKRETRNIHGMVHRRGIRSGLASGGCSVVGGVTDGVSGIFKKPIETAKTEGVLGFFKGAGQVRFDSI